MVYLRYRLRADQGAARIPKAMRGIRRGITEHERHAMAAAIATHLMLANWNIRRGTPAGAPNTGPDWSPHRSE